MLPLLCNAQDSILIRVVVLSDEDETSITGANTLMYKEQQKDELVAAFVSNLDGMDEFRDIETGIY